MQARPTRRIFFSRNKRGIAGSLVWVNFDRHGLLDLVCKLGGQFVANVDDIRPQFRTDENAFLSQNAIFRAPWSAAPGLRRQRHHRSASDTPDDRRRRHEAKLAKPWYSDQILPFDITLAGATE